MDFENYGSNLKLTKQEGKPSTSPLWYSDSSTRNILFLVLSFYSFYIKHTAYVKVHLFYNLKA